LTVKECAEHLQCSTITVYRLSSEGRLPSVRVGRLLRFDLEALQAWSRGPGAACQSTGGRHVRSKRR
jgi:excisionase family DNA binding protein